MFYKFPSIENLKQVRKELVKIYGQFNVPKVNLKGTVKIHGTNAGINITSSSVSAQSRSRAISIESDNAGFCNFVEDNREEFSKLQGELFNDHTCLTIYGEWCGGNIQKGVGVTGMDKTFVVFAARLTDTNTEDSSWLDHSFVANYKLPNTYLIEDFDQFESTDFDINSQDDIDNLTSITLQVESECPVAKKLNPDGNLVGEGIVWSFETDNHHFMFKVKGDKHSRGSGSKTVKVKEVYSEQVLSDLNKFFTIALTVDRLEQGKEYLQELGLDDSPKNTGEYLKWVSKDVLKECSVELSELYKDHGIEWKDVQKDIVATARNHFLNK